MSTTNRAVSMSRSCFRCAQLLRRACWALLATLVVQAAHATRPPLPEAIAAKVSFADLDLNTPAGVAVARERIASTANRLCRQFEDPRKVDHTQAREDCFRESLAAGLEQLNLNRS